MVILGTTIRAVPTTISDSGWKNLPALNDGHTRQSFSNKKEKRLAAHHSNDAFPDKEKIGKCQRQQNPYAIADRHRLSRGRLKTIGSSIIQSAFYCDSWWWCRRGFVAKRCGCAAGRTWPANSQTCHRKRRKRGRTGTSGWARTRWIGWTITVSRRIAGNIARCSIGKCPDGLRRIYIRHRRSVSRGIAIGSRSIRSVPNSLRCNGRCICWNGSAGRTLVRRLRRNAVSRTVELSGMAGLPQKEIVQKTKDWRMVLIASIFGSGESRSANNQCHHHTDNSMSHSIFSLPNQFTSYLFLFQISIHTIACRHNKRIWLSNNAAKIA